MTIDESVVNQTRNKIVQDLFITPLSLFPFVGGASLLMLAWATKAMGVMAVAGFFGILIGVGFAITNFLFNYQSLADKAVKEVQARMMRERERELDQLAARLKNTREKRDDDCLDRLRALYNGFLDDLENEKITVTPEIIMNVDAMFEECVAALSHQLDLHATAKQQVKGQKKKVLTKRNKVLDEIEESIGVLEQLVVQVRTSNTKENNIRLAKVRKELETHMQAAAKTKDVMISIEHGEDQSERFAEYLEE